MCDIVKQSKGLYSFTLERYPCINKILGGFGFFLIRYVCWDISKKVQNETTKRFSVGILVLTAVSKSQISLTSYNFVKRTNLALIG